MKTNGESEYVVVSCVTCPRCDGKGTVSSVIHGWPEGCPGCRRSGLCVVVDRGGHFETMPAPPAKEQN